MQGNPNTFQVRKFLPLSTGAAMVRKWGCRVLTHRRRHHNHQQTNLLDAPCKNPLCCCYGFALPCFAACTARQAALDALGAGIQDYVCCQVRGGAGWV